MEIKDKIQELINLKLEGAYWDFKREWYSKDKIADLLHDIICMANNLENTDSFIIIGIDEENSYKVRSVSTDSYRMNTQKLVDFIRSKKFAGGIRPTVYVQPVNFTTGEIDVIVIKNNYNTPFYLIENYRDVCANNIYTRVMDTNTPKNMSAEIHYVEYLWKKRFRLISTPIDFITNLMEMKKLWHITILKSVFYILNQKMKKRNLNNMY